MIHCIPELSKEANHGRNRHHRSIPDTARAFGDSAAATDAGRVADPTRIADPRRIADPGGITPNGDKPMMISSVVGRSFGRTASAGAAESVRDAQANSAEEAQRKFANRSRVLEEIVRLHRGRRATEPASAAPACQPISARSGASERGAQKRSGP